MFSTIPETINSTIYSNQNGLYFEVDDKCFVESSYMFDLNYKNIYN